MFEHAHAQPYGHSRTTITMLMDIRPKRCFVHLYRDCAFGHDIVTNISDSFSFDETSSCCIEAEVRLTK